MVEQLVIIGNGFDLNCELKTKFTDYFKENKPKDNDKNFLIWNYWI